MDMDIHIINKQNRIIYSSSKREVGLNFNACCKKLAKLLDERRDAGGFYDDGMNVEHTTGEIKKYTYMTTPDKKFIIELSFSLQKAFVFK